MKGFISTIALFLLSLTANAQCTGPANIFPLAAQKVCQAFTITLTDATTGGTWSTSNPAVASVDPSGVVYGISAGVVHISYTISGGCFRSKAVTVNAMPPTIISNSPICMGSTDQLEETVGGTWVSSNVVVATVGSFGLVYPVSAGNSTITFTQTGTGCNTTAVVTVNSLPAAITGTTTFCQVSTTTLSDSDPGGTWSSDNSTYLPIDPSTGVVTSSTPYGSDLNATITYTAPTTCTTTTDVTAKVLPTVTFTTAPGFSTPVGTSVTYTTQSGMSNYLWIFTGSAGMDYTITSGGTTSDNSTTLTWLTTGDQTTTVNYTDGNGCQGYTNGTNTTNVY